MEIQKNTKQYLLLTMFIILFILVATLMTQAYVAAIKTFTGTNTSSFTPRFGQRGPVGLEIMNASVRTQPFKYKTVSPYTKKIVTPQRISESIQYELKGKQAVYTLKKNYEKTKINLVNGVKQTGSTNDLPPTGSDVCCNTHKLRYYSGVYEKGKCIGSRLERSGWINACKGTRGIYLFPPNCQSGETICIMPKKIA